jgi:thymidine kinase
MYAGKTTELLRRIRHLRFADKKCKVIKYKEDTRYSVSDLATHDHQFHEALPCEKLSEEVLDTMLAYDCIGVDEGQFFPDIVEFCDALAARGKIVIVSALDGDFNRKPFGSILNLVPRAESVTKLSAVCMQCKGRLASFTQKIDGDKTLIEDVGGTDKYVAVCRQCHTQLSA